MDLFAERMRVKLEQGLRVLPTTQHSYSTDSGTVNNVEQGTTATVTKYSTLHVSRFDLSSVHLNYAILINEGLGQIQCIAIPLSISQRDCNGISGRCCADTFHFLGIAAEGILDVACKELNITASGPTLRVSDANISYVCIRYLPDPRRVTRYPNFRKSYQSSSSCSSIVDDGNCFLDCTLKVKPYRLGLYNGDPNCGIRLVIVCWSREAQGSGDQVNFCL